MIRPSLARAAKRFPGKALKGLKAWKTPLTINTDKAPTYGPAIAALMLRAHLFAPLPHRLRLGSRDGRGKKHAHEGMVLG